MLYWVIFFLSSLSGNFLKHVYQTIPMAKPFQHPDGAVSAAFLPHSNSSFYTAVATDLSVGQCYRSSVLWLQHELFSVSVEALAGPVCPFLPLAP